MNFNTYKFFRRHFNIPRRQKLRWCLVKERVSDKTEIRLGISLIGTPYYIDVACRRFFMECQLPAISRKAYPAVRTVASGCYEYRVETFLKLECPKSYIEDIYQVTLYDTLPQCVL